MISEDMFNRIANIFWHEDVRLENIIAEKTNYIIRYTPTNAAPYIELAQACAVKDYFDKYVFRMLSWLGGFVEN